MCCARRELVMLLPQHVIRAGDLAFGRTSPARIEKICIKAHRIVSIMSKFIFKILLSLLIHNLPVFYSHMLVST